MVVAGLVAGAHGGEMEAQEALFLLQFLLDQIQQTGVAGPPVERHMELPVEAGEGGAVPGFSQGGQTSGGVGQVGVAQMR